MRFFEALDEAKEREDAYNTYVTALAALHAKYQSPLHPKYLEHKRQTFMTMPIDQLRQEMQKLPNFLRNHEMDMERAQRDRLRKQEREAKSLNMGGNRYYRSEDTHERVVCSVSDPGYDKQGMPAHPMEGVDDELKGYYGVHVGGGWLGILKRDGYCDSGDAYLYDIRTDEMMEDGIEVFQMEDPHVANRDASTPESWIIFSKLPVIPAKYVELHKVIPEDEIEEAPPPYGME